MAHSNGVNGSHSTGALLSVTRWKSEKNPVGIRIEMGWDEIQDLVRNPLRVQNKRGSPGWAMTTFRDDHRSLENVEVCFGVAFDIDEEPRVNLDRLRRALSPFLAVFHSTFSHSSETPRWRAFLPTSRPMDAEEYRKVWAYVEGTLRSAGIGVGQAAKDPSRFWYQPIHTPEGLYEYGATNGLPINVDFVLATTIVPPSTIPPEAKSETRKRGSPGGRRPGVVERAAKWLESADASVQGTNGSGTAIRVIERVVRGFDLTDSEALVALGAWNERCLPPWDVSTDAKKENSLIRKIQEGRQKGDTVVGSLRDEIRQAPEREKPKKKDTDFSRANEVPIEKLLKWLTLEMDGRPVCPSCNAVESVSVHENSMSCAICAPVESWSNVDIVMRAAGLANGAAAKAILENFHVSPAPPSASGGTPLDPLFGKLQMDRGSPAKTAENVARVLAVHPDWRGGPSFDTYSRGELWPDPIPDPIQGLHRVEREITDVDHAAIQGWIMNLEPWNQIRVGVDTVSQGVRLAAAKKSHDLLMDWVAKLPEWDGTWRLSKWTVTYLGCDDTEYHRQTGRAWLIAMAERAMRPGALVDLIPVLEGKQGKGKNRALETLFSGGPSWAPWYEKVSGQKLEHDNTKRLACTRWVFHDDELRASDPKRLEEIKAWASQTRETYRVPYAREITVAQRRANLIGSTNKSHYLHDDTGNRRWVPWATGVIDYKRLEKDREQILSEAFFAYKVGDEKWRDSITDEVYSESSDQTKDRRVLDPLVIQVADLLEGKYTQGGIKVPTPGVLTTHSIGSALGYSVDKIDKSFETRIGSAMRELDYVTKRAGSGVRTRVYVPCPAYLGGR